MSVESVSRERGLSAAAAQLDVRVLVVVAGHSILFEEIVLSLPPVFASMRNVGLAAL